jgi:hypothetical protein
MGMGLQFLGSFFRDIPRTLEAAGSDIRRDRGRAVMLISKDNQAIRQKVLDFERRIEEMHLNFQKYAQGIESKKPDLESMERELLGFSRRKIYDLELSKQLDRVMFKFQNRKKIWIKWAEGFQRGAPANK